MALATFIFEIVGEEIVEQKKLYTVAQVSEMLGIGKAHVYSLIKSGQLPSLHLGGLKVRSETLDAFLTAQEENGF